MFGNIAIVYGHFCRICHTLLNYLHRIFHNPGTFYSDNKILKEPALSMKITDVTVEAGGTLKMDRTEKVLKEPLYMRDFG